MSNFATRMSNFTTRLKKNSFYSTILVVGGNINECKV